MATLNQPRIRIATRNSPLALWQANYVKALLQQAHPGLSVEVIGFVTTGDKLLAKPLSEIGGKGLFVKELERALVQHHADIAVHSTKDMPAVLHAGLTLAAVCARDDPRDALVSQRFTSLEQLPSGSVVGTSSTRRMALLRHYRPDLVISQLRGNVGTRLQKMLAGDFDAIILAVAGLKRLGEEARIGEYLALEQWVPAIGQGAIAIECRVDDAFVLECLAALDDPVTRACITAERAVGYALGASCHLPIAAYAACTEERMVLRALVGDPDGQHFIRAQGEASMSDASQLGATVAGRLLEGGAAAVLARY